jgi:hypothetical protein
MNLKFPPLSGGTVNGLNDAGIETFEGDFAKNVVRECTQNSLDAASDTNGTVEIRISRLSLTPKDLPFLPDLKKVLGACRDYWAKHDKAAKFFKGSISLVDRGSIDVIRISDFGTTGVDGDDNDITGRWFGLVKSRGVSNQKGSDSGGAFGIGKDAPLAGSALRTVIYSSRTKRGEMALQGVCRLVTHIGDSGELTQGTGFIGNFDPQKQLYTAIREKDQIPVLFQREQPGLDVWILGSRHTEDDWTKPFICSALSDFWPAIADKKVTFNVGGELISSTTLANLMRNNRFDRHVEEALPFYQSLVDRHAKEFRKELPNAGSCRLHLLLGRRDLPKQVCMVRRTGMVIERYGPRVSFLPFAGLFVCESTRGNHLLRSIEPPRHDKWDLSRADENPPAASALKEIREWIKAVIKKEIPHAGEDQFNESEVPPDLLEDAPENPITDADSLGEPDLGGNPTDPPTPQRVKVKSRTLKTSPKPGDSGTDENDDDVDDPTGGDGKKTGGRKGRSGGKEGDSSHTPKTPTLSSRAFTLGGEDQATEMVIRSDVMYNGDIWIEGVGDDGSTDKMILESAEVIGSGPKEVELSKIKNLSIPSDGVVRLLLKFRHPGKYALRATAS